MNIGIVGLGIVGNSVKLAFQSLCNIYINDLLVCEEAPHTKIELIQNCEFIFIGVPTPYNISDEKIDSRTIEHVILELNNLSASHGKKPTIIIKSAIVPRLAKKFKEESRHLNIVVSPEYLSERTHLHDFVNQKVMILGGDKDVCERISNLYLNHSVCNRACRIGYCTAEEASFIKYMENCFMATKNIFNNEFKKMYDKHLNTKNDSDFNYVLDCMYLDERMGVHPFRYTVPGPDGDLGYGGKCLPKDINAILSEAKDMGIDLKLLEAVRDVNDKIRTLKDWDTIDGAISE